MIDGELIAIAAAVCVTAAIVAVPVGRRVVQRSAKRLDPPADEMTRASAREAIARADGADSLIETALDIADRGLENARRTGFGSMVSGGYRDAWHMAALREARRHYARTGDSEGDLLRALSLAHEAERCATEGAIADRSFNQWLRRNGHRLGM